MPTLAARPPPPRPRHSTTRAPRAGAHVLPSSPAPPSSALRSWLLRPRAGCPPHHAPDCGACASTPDCPASICLNGGTCHLGARGHLECLCPQGFTGLYCREPGEAGTQGPAPPGHAAAPAPGHRARQPHVPEGGLQRFQQGSAVQLRSLRLTYATSARQAARTRRLPARPPRHRSPSCGPTPPTPSAPGPWGLGGCLRARRPAGEARTPPAVRSNHAPTPRPERATCRS